MNQQQPHFVISNIAVGDVIQENDIKNELNDVDTQFFINNSLDTYIKHESSDLNYVENEGTLLKEENPLDNNCTNPNDVQEDCIGDSIYENIRNPLSNNELVIEDQRQLFNNTKIETRKIEKRKRALKTTRFQYEIYLRELENNKSFRENKYNSNFPNKISDSWKALCNKLNVCGGPKKDIPNWKKTFSDWKAQTRKRARRANQNHLRIGSKGLPEKPLTALEQRLLTVMELAAEKIETPKEHSSVIVPTPIVVAPPPTIATIVTQQAGSSGVQMGKRRRRNGLVSLFKEITANGCSNSENTLRSIDDTLKGILRIQKKMLKLQQVEFQQRYPHLALPPSSDSDSD